MSARARISAALLVTALGASLCTITAASAQADTVSRGVTVPSFYTPPATLPAANGALVRSEPFKLALDFNGLNKTLPGTATRIMYKTTDSSNQPAAVTGAYLEPSTKWTGPGARPLVVVAPGTMGQGDQCSTSLGLEKGFVVGFDGQKASFSVSYEILSIYQLLAKGIAVVQTDYVGLGATDRLHTYVNRIDQAHAVLDAVRAARALSGTTVSSSAPVGLYGYSQGGGAVAAAAEVATSYAPDVAVKATYAGAPPADLGEVTAAIDGSELVGALGWSVNGFVQSDPELRPLVDKYLSDSGRAVLKDLSTSCVGDALIGYANKKSSSWTTNGETLAQIVAKEPLVQAFIDEQRIGKAKPAGIVRVATGINDNLVPHKQARQLAVDWCKRGGNVVYAGLDAPKTDSALVNHFVPLLGDQGDAITWLTDRLAGRPAFSNCWALPFMS
jgi:secretory lipase